jgi:Uncharacterized iron-regulated membrane protein
MRRQLVRLHRWFGVAIALFLFVAGLTGAIIAWDHELDAALNPSFFKARTAGPALSGLELARRVEAADPRLQVTYLPLDAEPGHTLQMMVLPRTNPATKQPYPLDFNQIAVDPATGDIQGRREVGRRFTHAAQSDSVHLQAALHVAFAVHRRCRYRHVADGHRWDRVAVR